MDFFSFKQARCVFVRFIFMNIEFCFALFWIASNRAYNSVKRSIFSPSTGVIKRLILNKQNARFMVTITIYVCEMHQFFMAKKLVLLSFLVMLSCIQMLQMLSSSLTNHQSPSRTNTLNYCPDENRFKMTEFNFWLSIIQALDR